MISNEQQAKGASGRMITLSGFADEISPDLEVQLDVMEEEGIRHLDFRGVHGKKVTQLDNDEVKAVKARLDERGFRVACIGSSVGKIEITGDLSKHLADYKRTLDIAAALGAPCVRIFSFYYAGQGKAVPYRGAILEQLEAYIRLAEQRDIVLLHENETRIYGDDLKRCLELFETFPSRHFRAALDPANYLRTGVKAATHAYPLLKPYLAAVHIKDSKFVGSGYQNVPAGEGDGELRELIAALGRDRFSGVLSVEPHLQPRSPASFRKAAGALKKLLLEAKLPWQ